jgi:hypothetical protein
MTLIPATFLAGALLSLLLPVGLLIALSVWYLLFVRRVPETADHQDAALSPSPPAAPVEPGGAPNERP